MSVPVWPAILGRFTWQSLPFVRVWTHPSLDEAICRRRSRDRGARGDRVRRHHHPAAPVALAVARMADQPGPQEDRHHVCRAVVRDAVTRAGGGGVDAAASGQRDRRARHRFARSFRAIVQHARQHHDFLHGDAVPDRAVQLRHAAPDRQPRRRLPAAQRDQPVADGERGRGHDGVAGGGALLDGRVVGLSALYRTCLQPRRGAGLLDLGGDAGIDRDHADRA